MVVNAEMLARLRRLAEAALVLPSWGGEKLAKGCDPQTVLAVCDYVQRLQEALAKTARFNQPADDPAASNLWPCWCSQERYGYVCRGIMPHDEDCSRAREALALTKEMA